MMQSIDDSQGVKEILHEIELLTRDGSDYLDAILHYCDKHEIEIESIAKYIKKNVVLKAKLQEEAEELNYLQKTSRLPI